MKSSEVGLFYDYYDSFTQIKQKYHQWDFLSLVGVNKCMRNRFDAEQKRMEELCIRHRIEFHEYFDKIKELNKLDMELYIAVVSSMMNTI